MKIPFQRRREPEFAAAIQALRKTTYDESATRGFEWLTGAFIWSDEEPLDEEARKIAWPLQRDLTVYRNLVIRGRPNRRLAKLWQRANTECPHWPGFRPERCDLALKSALEAEDANVQRTFKVLERAERIQAIRERRLRGEMLEPPKTSWWQFWKRCR